MNITLTGVDERTSLSNIHKLIGLGAEIGVLCNSKPDNRNRYPGRFWIYQAVTLFRGKVSVHFCGTRTRRILEEGGYEDILEKINRFQVNGLVSVEELANLGTAYPDRTIITQYRGPGDLLVDFGLPNHALLVDASGGRGISPDRWRRPMTEKQVGFAGGLGPDNLKEELDRIGRVAVEPYWVDMEGKLRDQDDWFDVDKALRVMEIFNQWKSRM